MKSALAICLAASLHGAPALADQIELTAPMHGATLHEGGIDMSVYFLDVDGTFEVVATYIDASKPNDPARLRMGLAEGDSVHFALPALRHVSFAFTRSEDSVIVTAEPITTELSQVMD